MKFGTSAPDAKTSSDSATDFIRYMNKNGEYRMRFLDEWGADWLSYWEHFSHSAQCSYPCTEEKSCPGCNVEDERERRASRKLLVNAVLVNGPADRGVGYANLWKLPAPSLQFDIERYFEKGGSVLDRDFTVIRYEEKDRVKYSMDREDKDEFDTSKFEKKDKQAALMAAYEYRWDEKVRAERKAEWDKQAEVREQQAAVAEVKEEEEEPPFDLPATETPKGLRVVEETEPEQTVTKHQIETATLASLKKLYKMAQIEMPEGLGRDELAANLIRALS